MSHVPTNYGVNFRVATRPMAFYVWAAQRDRLVEIRDNLIARIAEAEREGWLGEVEGLRVSLAGAKDKLAQGDRRSHKGADVDLGMPTIRNEDF
ncbi:hypothetical protein ACFZDP_40635 [Streptomyces mirabilis]|uniref:hypothetical protein n=1 Tax=Streptomyces mirabilis TaxID=68239 RepID=UPI0036E44236